jgi:hypothetical protein
MEKALRDLYSRRATRVGPSSGRRAWPLLLVASLALCASPVRAAPAPVISWEYDQLGPAVAYGAASDEFLVVWEDHHWGFGGDWDVYARRVAADGTPLGTAFGVAFDGAAHRLDPDVAYNSTHGEFLVVWEYEYSATDHDIYARRVTTAGELAGGEIAIATPGDYDSNPAVVFDPAAEEYLVIWERRAGSDEFAHHDIYAQRLSAGGTLQGGKRPRRVPAPGGRQRHAARCRDRRLERLRPREATRRGRGAGGLRAGVGG